MDDDDDVFVHYFLCQQTSQLPESLDLSTRSTNLTKIAFRNTHFYIFYGHYYGHSYGHFKAFLRQCLRQFFGNLFGLFWSFLLPFITYFLFFVKCQPCWHIILYWKCGQKRRKKKQKRLNNVLFSGRSPLLKSNIPASFRPMQTKKKRDRNVGFFSSRYSDYDTPKNVPGQWDCFRKLPITWTYVD